MCNTRSRKYGLDAPDDERKYRSKHVEQPREINLSYTVASCWSFSQSNLRFAACVLSVNVDFIVDLSLKRYTRNV